MYTQPQPDYNVLNQNVTQLTRVVTNIAQELGNLQNIPVLNTGHS